MRRKIGLGLTLACLIGAPLCAQDAYNVGYRLLKLPGDGDRPLVCALWYPTKADAAPRKYVPVLPHLEGKVAPDAAPAEGPFPLVVFSHGGISAGVGAMSWAEALAAEGFVVAAPDHHDEVTLLRSDMEKPPSREETLKAIKWAMKLSRAQGGGIDKGQYEHRPGEIRAVIDGLLKLSGDRASDLHGLVDAERIGLTGVSFGSWTTMVVAGGVAKYHDPRVKAALPMAPQVGGTDRAKIRVPLMTIFGEKETMALLDKKPDAPLKIDHGIKDDYAKANAPKFLIGVTDAEHMDFDPDGMTTRLSLKGEPEAKVYATEEVRKNDPLIRTIVRYQLAFWRRYLLDDVAAEKVLTAGDEKDLCVFEWDLGSGARSRPEKDPEQPDEKVPQEEPKQEGQEEPEGLIASEATIYGWIEKIVSQGIRRAGYPADAWTETFCKEQFEKFGLTDVQLQPVATRRWEPKKWSLTVKGADGAVDIPCFPVAYGPSTERTSGKLVKFDPERPNDDVAGKVVVFDYLLPEYPQSVVAAKATWSYDPDKTFAGSKQTIPLAFGSKTGLELRTLLSRKPAAVICVLANYFESQEYFAGWGGALDMPSDDVPGVWLSPANGRRLRDLMKDGWGEASLTIDSLTEDVTTHNVVGILPGATEERVVVASHHDGAWASAVEDASGVALALAQAEYWSRIPTADRPHTMMFVMTSGHLAGFPGSRTFTKDRKLMDRVVLEVHLEHAALEQRIDDGKLVPTGLPEPRWLYTTRIPFLEDAVKTALKSEDLRRSLMLPPNAFGPQPTSDGGPFHWVGVPLVNFVTTPVYLVDSQDTLDKVDREGLVPITRTVIRIISAMKGRTASGMRAARIKEEEDPGEGTSEFLSKLGQLKEAREAGDRGRTLELIGDLRKLWGTLSEEARKDIEEKYPGVGALMERRR